MNKVLKISLIIVLLAITFIGNFQNYSEASSYSNAMKQIISDTDNPTIDDPNINTTVNKVQSVTATIITVARIVGVTIAVVMLLAIAMKYMTAAPGDKADIKKSAVAYVVGAVVLFGAVGILEIISKFSAVIK